MYSQQDPGANDAAPGHPLKALQTCAHLLLATGVVALALTGCQSGDPTPETADTSQATRTTTAQGSSAPPSPAAVSAEDPIVAITTGDGSQVPFSCDEVTDTDIETTTGLTPTTVEPVNGAHSLGCSWSTTQGPLLTVAAVNAVDYGIENYLSECTPFSKTNPPPLSDGPVGEPVTNAVSGLHREARWCPFTRSVEWRTGGSFIVVGFPTDADEQPARGRAEALARLLYPRLDAGDPTPLTVTRKPYPRRGSAPNAPTPAGCPLTSEQASQILNTVIGRATVDSEGTCYLQIGDQDGAALGIGVSRQDNVSENYKESVKQNYADLVPGTRDTYWNGTDPIAWVLRPDSLTTWSITVIGGQEQLYPQIIAETAIALGE